MSFEATLTESVFERPGKQRVFRGERRQTASEIAGGGQSKLAPQAPTGAAIVGDRHDPHDSLGVAADRAQRSGKTMTTTEGDHARAALVARAVRFGDHCFFESGRFGLCTAPPVSSAVIHNNLLANLAELPVLGIAVGVSVRCLDGSLSASIHDP